MTDDDIRYHFDHTWPNATLAQISIITGRTVPELKRILKQPKPKLLDLPVKRD